MDVCTSSRHISLVPDHDSNDDTDIIDLSAVEILVWVEFLDLSGERTISLAIHTRSFGFPNNVDRQQCLQGILILLGNPAILCEIVYIFGYSRAFLPSLPSVEPSHLPAHNLQQLARAQIVPDTISSKHQNITMTYFMICAVRILRGIAQLLPTEKARESEYLWRYYRELKRCIERVCLRIREMVDSVQAKMYEPRIAKVSHLQVSLFVPSSYTCRAPSPVDFALPDYLLVRITENKLRPKISLVLRIYFSGDLSHSLTQAVGEVGGVNALIGPAADSIGYSKCHVAAVACPRYEKSILAAVRPSCENVLPGGNLRLGVEGEDIILRVEAASFGRERCPDSVREGGTRTGRRRRF